MVQGLVFLAGAPEFDRMVGLLGFADLSEVLGAAVAPLEAQVPSDSSCLAGKAGSVLLW